MTAPDAAPGRLPAALRLAVVDLDGTLVDSVPDLAYCVDEMLRRTHRTPIGEARVRTYVGNGADRLVKRALTGTMDAEPPEDLFQQAYPLFLDLYGRHTSERSRPFPGVMAGLERLRRGGLHLACVTNKPGRFTEILLNDLELRAYFALVLGGDALPRKKPDPMPLLHACAHFGVAPEEAVFIGDSVTDVAAARAAGLHVVCVSYGYNHGEDIREAGADAVVDSLEELPAVLSLSALPGARPQASPS